uniref:AFG2 interacting ribosome maturation factor n=1 Tax=Amphilophus citrinellus TaxID=61819 RepID=A0A3Q0S195_AMPCI
MGTLAVATLHQALRKSFTTLESNQKVWKSVLDECSPLMVSLGNLAEQSRALSNVQISNTALRSFPDLEERLRFKLLQATDTVLGKLNEKMSSLQSVRDAISNQVAAVLQLYEQNMHSMDLLTVTERSPTTPSVADMLEWLQDAERHYRQQYPFFPIQAWLFVFVLYSSPFSPLNCCVQIPEDEDSVSDTENTLCKVSFFVESQ